MSAEEALNTFLTQNFGTVTSMEYIMDLKEECSDENDDDDYLCLPEREDCIYTSCYCEENVWKLCDYIRETQPSQLENVYAVFVSNADRTIPLWMQKVGSGTEKIVFWDYHVFMLYNEGNKCCIYDLDSVLPFPTDISCYVARAIRSDADFNPCYHRLFRVIDSCTYLQTFASDRSHMKNCNGSWRKPPPDYPCISTNTQVNNIQDFINMDCHVGVGLVMTSTEFAKKFTPLKKSLKNCTN